VSEDIMKLRAVPKLAGESLTKQSIEEAVAIIDMINHPPHYKTGGIEVIDFIEAKKLSYNKGNAVKYIARAGVKSPNPIEDLKKAAWYINREIELLSKEVF
jgi:hypothetical protein